MFGSTIFADIRASVVPNPFQFVSFHDAPNICATTNPAIASTTPAAPMIVPPA
jgi:hypothetical protein